MDVDIGDIGDRTVVAIAGDPNRRPAARRPEDRGGIAVAIDAFARYIGDLIEGTHPTADVGRQGSTGGVTPYHRAPDISGLGTVTDDGAIIGNPTRIAVLAGDQGGKEGRRAAGGGGVGGCMGTGRISRDAPAHGHPAVVDGVGAALGIAGRIRRRHRLRAQPRAEAVQPHGEADHS